MVYRVVIFKSEISEFMAQQIEPIIEGKVEKDLVFENLRQIGIWIESDSGKDAIDKSLPILANYVNQHFKRLQLNLEEVLKDAD